MDNKDKKSTFYIRIIIGMYLLYIDYSLIFGKDEVSLLEGKIMVVAVVFFAVSAIVLIASSIKSLNAINKED